ncbi:hypothetical protein FPV67DRAFT_1574815 [Lyophyllum atratum]|nr:hypothetical protein FPV67DRAFT_1574815 [Lyophyllum atratum]
MAKVSLARSEVESASESDDRASKKTKKTENKVVQEHMDVDEEEGDEGSDDEPEYEIEAILDAKRGSFPEGRIGYLVKWKGYGESENSWVDEQDAGNATVLIDEYWKTHTKKPRKSTDTKSPKRPRKSIASEEAPDTSTKKRGRKSLPAAASVTDDEDVKEVRTTKKVKKNGAMKPESEERSHPMDEEAVVLTDMAQYMNLPTWEHIVKTIDTIEKEADDSLSIYFRLNSGERIKESSKLCAERFPQKLIKFYESNLRWRSASEHGGNES